jgi:uncharacterized spore protein YtfJ
MKVSKTLHSLVDRLQVGASVRNVYGDAVQVGERTVIPIARVSYGFGAGGRAGGKEKTPPGQNGGGGAGLSARPVGALEITAAGTRFIAFPDPVRLGAALLAGLILGLTIRRQSARRPSVADRIFGDPGPAK